MVKGIMGSALVGVVAIAMGAGVAHADAPPVVAAADTKTTGGAEVSGDTTPDVTKTPEAPTTVAWPIEIINRPVVLPKGAWSAGLGLSANNDFSAVGADATGAWGLSYGVTDQLSVGVGYGIGVEPSSDGKGPVGLNVGYGYYSGDTLSLTATASAGYDFAGETMGPLSVGTYVWYNITPVITLITPGGQVSVGLEDPNEISFSLPVSVGYQATKNIFATFDTNLMPNLGVKDSDNMVIGSDTLPVGVSGYFSPNRQMDIGVSISTDAKNSPGDNMSFGLVFLYYGGV